MPRRRRRTHPRRGAEEQCRAAPHRLRAQRRPPVPARRQALRGQADLAHRIRRPVPLHPAADFERITPAQALKHPTWVMGRRITIDSATMMNKGFEIIEACRLFNLPPAKVRVTIHPQSTVHSLVEFIDGSILAQISVTDMRLPILYALAYPERVDAEARRAVPDLRPRRAQPARLCPARPGPFPLPAPGLRSGRIRPRGLHRAECRRRDRRRRVPSGRHSLPRHPAYNREGAERNRFRTLQRLFRTCSRRTRRPGSCARG